MVLFDLPNGMYIYVTYFIYLYVYQCNFSSFISYVLPIIALCNIHRGITYENIIIFSVHIGVHCIIAADAAYNKILLNIPKFDTTGHRQIFFYQYYRYISIKGTHLLTADTYIIKILLCNFLLYLGRYYVLGK